MAKQDFQAANVVIEKPLGGVIHLVAGRVAEKIGPFSINKALPGGSAKAAIQPGTPTVWNIAGTRDQPVDGHTKWKVYDDLKLLGVAECLQRSPVEVGAVGVEESNALRISVIQPRRQLLNQSVGVPDLDAAFAVRVFGPKAFEESSASGVCIEEIVLRERVLEGEGPAGRAFDELLFGLYEFIVQELKILFIRAFPSRADLRSTRTGERINVDQFERLLLKRHGIGMQIGVPSRTIT